MRLGFLAGGGMAFVAGIAAIQASGAEPTSGSMTISVGLLVGGAALLTVACLLVSLGAVKPRGDLA